MGYTITVYLDVFFITNLAMDYLLLSLLKRILKPSTIAGRRGSLFLAALFGSAWACGGILGGWYASLFWRMATFFFAGSVMLWIAFGKQTRALWLRSLLWLFILSMVIGGFFGLWGSEVPAMGFLIAGAYFGGNAVVTYLNARVLAKRQIYEVKLFYGEKEKVVLALLDTGNHLYEPYGNQPVHVISKEVCDGFCETVTQVIYIPFRAVGTENGMLPAIRIDAMDVRNDGTLVRHYDAPWLAISRTPLCADGTYEMLLHGDEQN